MDDPTSNHPQPPMQSHPIEPPGHTGEMPQKPDHGEQSYKGSGRLLGRAAIITGADSGIGRAVAIAFAREGADVLISYLNEHEDAEQTARWVREAGRRPVLMPGDVSEQGHCREIVQQAVAEFGRLDILVNNAAMQRTHQDISEISAEEWDKTFRTNIYSQFFLCQAAVPHMKPGAAIVNTTSINAKKPTPQLLAYATTKGAIANFTAGLAGMLAEKGIRVNAVAPGPIWTPLIPSTMPHEKAETFGEETPLGRARPPAARAGADVQLGGRRGGYITGAVIPVTGGTPML